MGGDRPKDREPRRSDRVTVVPDKKEYQPGELAELLVVAPFAPAEGLLTVRRQGIVHVERFTMKSTTSQAIKVKLDDALVPNAEIRVDLVGAGATRTTRRQPRRAATQATRVCRRARRASKILPTARTLAREGRREEADARAGRLARRSTST